MILPIMVTDFTYYSKNILKVMLIALEITNMYKQLSGFLITLNIQWIAFLTILLLKNV